MNINVNVNVNGNNEVNSVEVENIEEVNVIDDAVKRNEANKKIGDKYGDLYNSGVFTVNDVTLKRFAYMHKLSDEEEEVFKETIEIDGEECEIEFEEGWYTTLEFMKEFAEKATGKKLPLNTIKDYTCINSKHYKEMKEYGMKTMRNKEIRARIQNFSNSNNSLVADDSSNQTSLGNTQFVIDDSIKTKGSVTYTNGTESIVIPNAGIVFISMETALRIFETLTLHPIGIKIRDNVAYLLKTLTVTREALEEECEIVDNIIEDNPKVILKMKLTEIETHIRNKTLGKINTREFYANIRENFQEAINVCNKELRRIKAELEEVEPFSDEELELQEEKETITNKIRSLTTKMAKYANFEAEKERRINDASVKEMKIILGKTILSGKTKFEEGNKLLITATELLNDRKYRLGDTLITRPNELNALLAQLEIYEQKEKGDNTIIKPMTNPKNPKKDYNWLRKAAEYAKGAEAKTIQYRQLGVDIINFILDINDKFDNDPITNKKKSLITGKEKVVISFNKTKLEKVKNEIESMGCDDFMSILFNPIKEDQDKKKKSSK